MTVLRLPHSGTALPPHSSASSGAATFDISPSLIRNWKRFAEAGATTAVQGVVPASQLREGYAKIREQRALGRKTRVGITGGTDAKVLEQVRAVSNSRATSSGMPTPSSRSSARGSPTTTPWRHTRRWGCEARSTTGGRSSSH